jgi:hypothetical protein
MTRPISPMLAAAAPAPLAPGHAAPILDYAGRASRTRLRLPARSIIRWDRTPGELRVVERLDGQFNAFLALCFAAFTFAMLVASALPLLARWQRNAGSILLLTMIGLTELATMAAVIDSTWRVTRLIVTRTQLALRFWSPLRGTTAYAWPAEKLQSVRVAMSKLAVGGPPIPELEFYLWGEPLVRLFVGHPLDELENLIAEIHALQPPRPPVPAVPQAPVAAPLPAALPVAESVEIPVAHLAPGAPPPQT